MPYRVPAFLTTEQSTVEASLFIKYTRTSGKVKRPLYEEYAMHNVLTIYKGFTLCSGLSA